MKEKEEMDERIVGKIDFLKLKSSIQKINDERCLVIPIKSNNLCEENGELFLRFIGFPIKNRSNGNKCLHVIKQYLRLSKRDNSPVLGNTQSYPEFFNDNIYNPYSTSLFTYMPKKAPARQKSKNKPASARPAPAKKARNVIPPPLHEVEKYCRERRNSVDPEAFIDFYQSKGWMVGSNKMKDWQAAVRTWEKKDAKDSLKGMKPFIIDDGIKYVLGPDGQYYHGRTGSLYIR